MEHSIQNAIPEEFKKLTDDEKEKVIYLTRHILQLQKDNNFKLLEDVYGDTANAIMNYDLNNKYKLTPFNGKEYIFYDIYKSSILFRYIILITKKKTIIKNLDNRIFTHLTPERKLTPENKNIKQLFNIAILINIIKTKLNDKIQEMEITQFKQYLINLNLRVNITQNTYDFFSFNGLLNYTNSKEDILKFINGYDMRNGFLNNGYYTYNILGNLIINTITTDEILTLIKLFEVGAEQFFCISSLNNSI